MPRVSSDDGPTYQGRLLPGPTRRSWTKGLSFDVGTLVTRRRVLSLLGVGAGAVALAACTPASPDGGSPSASAAGGEIPDETAGPVPRGRVERAGRAAEQTGRGASATSAAASTGRPPPRGSR